MPSVLQGGRQALSVYSAPRVFTKVLAPLLALLRTQGIQVDGLHQKYSFPAIINVHKTIQILQVFFWVGRVINYNKFPLPGIFGSDPGHIPTKISLPEKKILSHVRDLRYISIWDLRVHKIEETSHNEILLEGSRPNGRLLWGNAICPIPFKISSFL